MGSSSEASSCGSSRRVGPERAGGWLREVREALSGVVEGGGQASGTGSANAGSTPGRAPETESGVGPMDAVFTKCERCGQPIYEKDLRARFNVCPHCEFHYPLSAPERIRLLTDAGSFEERDGGMFADDPLGFEDYRQRLEKARAQDRARRRHPERDRRHRGEAGGARRARLPVYRGVDGERRR